MDLEIDSSYLSGAKINLPCSVSAENSALEDSEEVWGAHAKESWIRSHLAYNSI